MPLAQPPTPHSRTPADRRGPLLFALLCVMAFGGVLAYALYSRAYARRDSSRPPATSVVDDSARLAAMRRAPHLLFRHTALGPTYGHVTLVPLDAPEGVRYTTPLSCDRVHGTRESGLCLQASRGVLTTYHALSFDGAFRIHHTFNLAGAPSRTRVSRDGRAAAATVFVSGDSYSANSFSTRTTIFDLRTSTAVADLEQFAVQKNGRPFRAADFNFWGVTFADDGDRFYATLGSGGVLNLVEGRVSRREMVVLREAVECPSLSPDAARLVFKSRTTEDGRRLWRLHVLDLKTQTEVIVNERRSVDDQAEWLDGGHVLYALPRGVAGTGTSDIWIADASGSGTPRLFVQDATSPSVVRP